MKNILFTFIIFIAILSFLGLLGPPAWAGDAVALTDTELDEIYGRQAPQDNDVTITSSCGNCNVTAPLVSDFAQQHATALIIVNNVAGVVNAQVNLIYNSGTVGSATQTSIGMSSAN